MLLNMTVENILSFRERTEISFAPVLKNSKHNPKTHVLEDKKTGAKALRLGAFFGANASGKTNIIKVLDFMKDIVIQKSIDDMRNITHFASKEKSFIAIEVCLNNIIYKYSLVFCVDKIIEENLQYKEKIKSHYKEVFKRTQYDFSSENFSKEIDGLSLLALNSETTTSLGNISENRIFKDAIKEINKKKKEDVDFEKIGEDLKNYKELVSGKEKFLKHIENIYHFFENDLRIVFPEMSFSASGLYVLLKEQDGFKDFLKNLLSDFDTGICDVDFKELGQEFVLREVFDGDIFKKEKFEKKMKNEITDIAVISSPLQRIFVKKEDNEIIYNALKTIHSTSGENVIMGYGCNSDGTKRLIDLAVLFFHETQASVTIIDEIENSLHPHIVRELVIRFIKNENLKKTQFIIATHAEYLLDQKILRKDEIYIITKKPHGNSVIERLTDITDERFDKNLRLTYNKGYYGGIPNIF